MKTYVLMIAQSFPQTHAKAGRSTHFISQIYLGNKMHTLRGSYELWANRFKQTRDTSGLKCLERFGKLNRSTLWARTFLACLVGQGAWFSTRCNLIWKMKGTKYNRVYFQLQVLALHTNESEYGLLLTPATMERDEHPKKMVARALAKGYKNGTKYNTLLSQVLYSGMLATPAASNYKGASSMEALEARGRVALKSNTLPDQFAQAGKSSQLNPPFVAEMMGFPLNWTALPFQNGAVNQ